MLSLSFAICYVTLQKNKLKQTSWSVNVHLLFAVKKTNILVWQVNVIINYNIIFLFSNFRCTYAYKYVNKGYISPNMSRRGVRGRSAAVNLAERMSELGDDVDDSPGKSSELWHSTVVHLLWYKYVKFRLNNKDIIGVKLGVKLPCILWSEFTHSLDILGYKSKEEDIRLCFMQVGAHILLFSKSK